MGREKQCYRDNLEDILTWSGGKRVLLVSEVVAYTGMSRPWVERHVFEGIKVKDGISAATLARRLSGF